ncbi:anthrone oxygenase family protein [Jejuia spongiicola]|uniref:DUF1772 domain-containing protein n=1 Tax=Jejuia spongiicola TaxID=2942207 RepID=A0ABT0QER7_9FLAO|nr:DUF1772 domain-containing protein [Jejuia spongiicola]MCL6295083.1 DUF1772 domain-containing protein [Jejuia spongiicola]
MKKIALIIQVVSIICLGTFTGAMIMLYTAILSFWKKAEPLDFLDWYVEYASGIMGATGPLVMSSLILPLVCFFLVIRIKQSRIYWAISFLLSVIIMAITLSYFVDVNTSFANQSIELNHVKETLDTWGANHLIRILLAFTSATFAGFGLVKYLSKN